ncbi:MAG: DUF2203 domain-containing protein [Bryobacteraceae bacterium]
MPRFFTILEAEALLPQIQKYLEKLASVKRQYDEAEAQIGNIQQRIALSGGMVPPRAQLLELKQQKDGAARRLKETIESIHETGCQLKDFEMGLIDFPTLYRGKEVYLCWKSGERDIGYWHHVEDGYRGRRPIDSEFLSNHRGS